MDGPTAQQGPASTAWIKDLAGRFLVFDGPDGSGKSTQLQRLIADAEAQGVEVCVVREPGGTEIGEAIRRVLLDPAVKEAIDPTCEMMLFMASRAQLLAQKIRPALQRGCLVLADRFISSTLAYQGTAGGTPIADILRVGQVALGDTWPDLVVVFDVDEATAAERLNPLLRAGEFVGSDKDRMELKGAAFHRRVRQGYLDQARQDPDRYAVINAMREEASVYHDLVHALQAKLGAV
ncbi:MAG: dTMP kinase [Planctomycetota bacterium]